MTGKANENPAMPDAPEISPAEPVLIREPEPERPSAGPVTAPKPSRKRGGTFLPLLLGGIAAAAVGAATTVYLLPQLPARWQPASALLAESDAQNTERFAAMQAELAALRAAMPQAPDLGPLHAALTDVDARLAALESRPVVAAPDAAPAIEALQAELAALRAELAQTPDTPQATSAEIAAAAADASARIVAAEAEAAAIRTRAEAEAAALRAEAEARSSDARGRAALAQLTAAFENGAPLAEPLAQLQAVGLPFPPEFAIEVPTLAALRGGFAPAARAALAAARADAPGEGMFERLGSFLLAQTGARSLTAREGADADAVLSRAEAALGAGDLPKVQEELAMLPDAARAEMADWLALVERRVAATRALADLAESLN